MRRKIFLVCLLLCLALLGSSRPGHTESSNQIPADLLDDLQKQGWVEVSPGVMQRSLGGNRVETLGFGAAGLRFQLREMKAHLVDLRKDYAQQPTRQLRIAIRAHRAQILRIEEALKKTTATDGLEVSAESLIDPGSACSATYDAVAIAYPRGAKASAYFNSPCGEVGEVYTHSKSSAMSEDGSDILATKSDPALNTPRIGSNVSASAATSVPGVTNCHSYAYASVLSYDTGLTYAQDDNNYSCVTSLPSPWTKSDVGTVGLAGNASYDNGVFELIAGGTDLAGTTDAFHFVYQTLSGDGTIVANVTGLQKPAGSTRTLAGVTFRNDLTAGSAHATMTITSEGEAQFRRRTTANGTTASDSAATTFAPQWLKLVRSGNTFTAYLSANGTTWTQVGTPQTVTMSTTVYVGLVALRSGGTATGAARFESVSVSIPPPPPNTAPDARGDQILASYNLTTTIQHATLLSNDFDADGDARTLTGFNTAGLAGTLSCPAGGTNCTYTPPYGYTGVSSYTYTVSDGRGGTDTATVKLKVGVTGSTPVAVNDQFTTTRNTAVAFTIFDVLANDSDADGDVLNVQLVSGARDYGSVSCTTPTYNCAYTPSAGFVGNDRFSYTASDGASSANAYIQVAVLPPAVPVFDAREDQRATTQNAQLYISYASLLANDYDPEGDVLTVASVDTAGLAGTLECDPSGCLFKPGINYYGNTKLRYTATDGKGSSETATVRIRVGPTNHTPVVANDALLTKVNTPLRFSIFELMKNDYDLDNDPFNVTVYPNAGRGTVSCGNPAYWCTYTPNANVTGTDTFTYVVSDGIAYSPSATVNVTVTP